MNVIYSDTPVKIVGPSIFLVGPTPRSTAVPSWRPKAIEYFKQYDFKGTIMVPEREDWHSQFNYNDQIEWEYFCLTNCSVVMAWVPRDLATMPAFTTNVEFGYWLGKNPKKLFYGRPDGSPHTSYLDWFYKKECDRSPCASLQQLVFTAISATKLIENHYQVALAQRIAEQWVEHPEFIEQLAESLQEKPENW